MDIHFFIAFVLGETAEQRFWMEAADELLRDIAMGCNGPPWSNECSVDVDDIAFDAAVHADLVAQLEAKPNAVLECSWELAKMNTDVEDESKH